MKHFTLSDALGCTLGDVLAVDHHLFDCHILQVERANEPVPIFGIKPFFGVVKVNGAANIFFRGYLVLGRFHEIGRAHV